MAHNSTKGDMCTMLLVFASKPGLSSLLHRVSRDKYEASSSRRVRLGHKVPVLSL